jgi:glyoxylase-like metal-dependent hydrolase (beta-lactamase superfamily II)
MLITNPPVEITDSLLMLGTRLYPLYLVQSGEEGAIFEGGVGAMGPVLKQQIERLGIAAGCVKQIIVTHAHPDHVMAVPMFRTMFPGITVCASKAAVATLSTEKVVAFFAKADQMITGTLVKMGVIGEEHRPELLTAAQVPVDRVLSEGSTVAVGEARFDVLETPGHSDCSLSFHEPTAGILIASDATGYYIPEHDWWWPNYFTGYGAYASSLRRLAALDAEVLCLSHNAAVKGAEDVATYFRNAISATETYHERIVSEFRAGKAPGDIAAQLGAEVYEKTQLAPLEFFQRNCLLLSKQSLQHEGLSVEQ